ncbi:hypothetical protein D8T54_19665 [Vibrio vulnificus]|nr:hypothetical protein D8T54_19665 [Vibrio vulnificus]RZR41901.1 hypothetical protein D8T58_20150 [Vibrio vulnificus]
MIITCPQCLCRAKMTSAVKTSNAHAEIYCQCQNLNCSSTFTLDATLSRCKPTQSKQEK